jgi:probable F420-dependent oxidoreductase
VQFALYGLHRGSSVDPDVLRRRAARAEAVGFEGLWVGDHVALPDTAPDPATEPRLEALTALTFLAAATRTVRLGVGVLVLPQRQPVLLAKQLTSLDVLSGGRLIVGLGGGYVEQELGAFGVSLADRGAMTDEHVDALLALWAGQREFAGRWVRFSGVRQTPAPVQRPRPPLVVGGHARAALRRAVRVGDGWFGWELDVAQAAAAVRALDEQSAAAGRTGRRLEVSVTPPQGLTTQQAADYAEAGVDRLVLQPGRFTGSEIDELIELAAEELIGRVTGEAGRAPSTAQ